jgi:hypothetical protein
MRRSGSARLTLLALALAVVSGGCWRYGFAGGGLPAHVRTFAVVPFENQTPSPELSREVTDGLRVAVESRLGLRLASEEKADAIFRGVIVRYDPDSPVAFSADASRSTQVRRRLEVVVDAELFDQVTGKVIWSKKGIMAPADYGDRGEADGRKQALQKIISEVIEGAQSQW